MEQDTAGAAQPDDPVPGAKPKLTPAQRRRRKQSRGWIPTIIILGVIVGAVITAVVFQGVNLGGVPAVPVGNSNFNLAGLRVVNGAADVQLNLRKPIASASVGLSANTTRTFGPFDNISLEVDLTGTHTTASIFVDTMTVVTHGGALSTISTRTHADDFTTIHDQLETFAQLGITNLQMASFQEAMPNGAGSATSFFSLAVGDGTALGVPTHIAVSCAGPKGCEVTTKTTLLTK